jgi:uncharacterized protein
VAFEWDPAKAVANLSKRGIAFELAQEVWDDPLHVVLPDRFEDDEHRWHALGLVGSLTILVVVHTYPVTEDEDLVRIVGARKATAQERKRYENECP